MKIQAQLLIKHGADVNKADQLGFSPFLHACAGGHIDLLMLLSQHGARPKHSYLGATPMTIALGQGQLKTVKLLHALKLSAEPLSRFAWCPSPMMAAAFFNEGTDNSQKNSDETTADDLLMYLLEQK